MLQNQIKTSIELQHNPSYIVTVIELIHSIQHDWQVPVKPQQKLDRKDSNIIYSPIGIPVLSKPVPKSAGAQTSLISPGRLMIWNDRWLQLPSLKACKWELSYVQ